MDSKSKRLTPTIALFLVLATGQLYSTIGLAALAVAEPNPVALPQQPTAVLTTAGNKPISVNGADAVSGATVLSAATVETPEQVGANIDIPGHSRLEISAKAKLVLTFAASGVKVTLIRGCVVLHTRKGISGEIGTESGKVLGRTDPTKDDDLRICEPGAGGAGIGTPVVVGIIGAGAAVAAILALSSGGDSGVTNPSPSAP